MVARLEQRTTGARTVLDDSVRDLVDDLDAGYATFVRAHADAVYCTALRLSRSAAEADDVAQETFVRAYRSLRRFDAERLATLEPRPWLLTITLNLWRNRLRSASRRPAVAGPPEGDPPDPRPGPEDAAARSESTRALVALLARLPERHRVPVVLHHVVGLSYPEVATVLACPVGTAKANAARGLEQLRRLAAEDGPGPATTRKERP